MNDRTRPAILIVEDEWLIADLLEVMLTDLGYQVIGPAPNVRQALALIEAEAPDAALLDVSLGETTSFPIADAMTLRGAPFMFLTGYVAGDLPAQYSSSPMLAKPVSAADLKAPLERLAGAGTPTGSFATSA